MSYTGKRNQMIEKRAALTEQARGILIDVESEGRDLRPYEDERVKELQTKIETLSRSIDRLAPLAAEESKPLVRQVDTSTHDGPSRAPRSGEGVVLGREERMADWYEETHGSSWDPDNLDGRQHGREDFSLGRVVRGMCTGNWSGAELERRALGEGTNSAGGFLTPELLSSGVIDRVRAASRVIEAGARTIPVESDSLAIPRLATGVTAAWRAEHTSVAESDSTFERVTLAPKTLAVMCRLSYELMQDMTSEGASIIEHELVQALAIELDRVALRGSGTAPEPRGVLNQAGVALLANGANGGTITYDMLLNAIGTVSAAGFDPNATILAPRGTKTLGGLKDTTNQYLTPPAAVSGHRILTTTNIPITLTTGTSTDTSEAYTAQWNELLIGFRPSVEIQVDRRTGPAGMVSVKGSSERYMDTMQFAILCFLRADIQLAHPAAFAVNQGVR